MAHLLRVNIVVAGQNLIAHNEVIENWKSRLHSEQRFVNTKIFFGLLCGGCEPIIPHFRHCTFRTGAVKTCLFGPEKPTPRA